MAQNKAPSRAVTHARSLSITRQYSSPLPPPAVLAEYERIRTGSIEVILKMAEDQATHRRVMEKKVVFGGILNERLGLVFAFLSLLCFLAATVYLGVIGQVIPASVLGTGGLVGVISVFIYGSRWRGKKKEEDK